MKKTGWSRHAAVRYILLQLPGLALFILVLILLRRWVHFPAWTFWLILFLWVLKDLIMFPLVWRAYDRDNPQSMIGEQGTVADRLSPSGYVSIRGELWRAEVMDDGSSLEKGEIVTVKAVKGLTLRVQAAEKG